MEKETTAKTSTWTWKKKNKRKCNGDLHTWVLERQVYSGANAKAHLKNLF